jgi:hypothetical protein
LLVKEKCTWGSKTFQYPEEKKKILLAGNISRVAASEKEKAQTKSGLLDLGL